MGKTENKILILVLVIVMAVTGVLVFYPTIVAPSSDVPVNNLHRESLSNSIKMLSIKNGTKYNDSVYAVVIDKFDIYKKESFLSNVETDVLKEDFIQTYLPIFIEESNSKFSATIWNENDHKEMLKRIAFLSGMKVDAEAKSVLSESQLSDLRKIKKVIDEYGKAKKIAGYSSFTSLKDADEKINLAKKYSFMVPLKNCKSLVNKLSKVKENIGRSHYQKVLSEVEGLANYRNMSEDTFKVMMKEADDALKEYKSNSSKYGANPPSHKILEERLMGYYRSADEFYNRKDININTNGQWQSISSPSSSYRAYQSTYNYHRASTDAIMSFTIKGYESFSFYVRSNGEASCDYLLVGLNGLPTVDSYKFSTKDKASSGTQLYNYQSVTLNNLSKSETYTIYVVYRKDSSVDKGDDRGYVLIPHVK